MFEKLGKKSLAAPLVIAVLLCLFLSLAITPILRVDPSDVPFLIVNLDEGATTATGSSNLGETLTDALASGDDSLLDEYTSDEDEDDGSAVDESAVSSISTSISIDWTQMDSEEEALEALDGLDYYGAIVIPENFTAQYISYLVGVGDAPEITVYLNAGKNAQMASSLATVFMEACLQAGIAIDAEIINSADLGGGTMSAAIAVQMMVMPLTILSLITSILTALLFWKNDVTGLRRKHPFAAAIVMCLLVGLFSAVNAGLALFPDGVAGGMDLPAGELYPFLWLSSFCMMLACTGLCAFNLPLGVICGVGTFILGLSTALLGPEMLPEFWAEWVYPWAPQAYIGNGVRMILYFDASPYENGTTHLVVLAAIGVVAILLAVLLACRKNRKELQAEQAAQGVQFGTTGASTDAAAESDKVDTTSSAGMQTDSTGKNAATAADSSASKNAATAADSSASTSSANVDGTRTDAGGSGSADAPEESLKPEKAM